MKQKSYLVTQIEFDFSNSTDEVSKDDQKFITDNTLGVWYAFDDEHLLDKVSDTIGFCIKDINFEGNKPHALTAYL